MFHLTKKFLLKLPCLVTNQAKPIFKNKQEGSAVTDQRVQSNQAGRLNCLSLLMNQTFFSSKNRPGTANFPWQFTKEEKEKSIASVLKRTRDRRNGFLSDFRGGSWNRLGSGRRNDNSGLSLLRCETKGKILEQFGPLARSTKHEETGKTSRWLSAALSRHAVLARAQLLETTAEELLRGAVRGMYEIIVTLHENYEHSQVNNSICILLESLRFFVVANCVTFENAYLFHIENYLILLTDCQFYGIICFERTIF